jgi:hypothetical protein
VDVLVCSFLWSPEDLLYLNGRLFLKIRSFLPWFENHVSYALA